MMLRYHKSGMVKVVYKRQWLLTCLLCILILISSIDRVPDPPSIKPHHGPAISSNLGGYYLPAVSQDRGSDVVLRELFSAQARYFDLSLLSNDKLVVRSAVHLGNASDSSPPYCVVSHEQLS